MMEVPGMPTKKKGNAYIARRKKIRKRHGVATHEWRDGKLVDKATGFAVQGAPEIPKPSKKPPEPKRQPFRSLRY
jgi:hypothetical protein